MRCASPPQALMQSLETKVSRGEIAKLLKQAAAAGVAAAAASAASSAALMPGRALKGTCLACDRELHTRRPESVGPLPSAAGLLPESEQFQRPATAQPIGPGLRAAEYRRAQLEGIRGVHDGGAAEAASAQRKSTGGGISVRPRGAAHVPRAPVFV